MIDPGLKDKVVLVTGGNNPFGIGAAIARASASHGARLFEQAEKVFGQVDIFCLRTSQLDNRAINLCTWWPSDGSWAMNSTIRGIEPDLLNGLSQANQHDRYLAASQDTSCGATQDRFFKLSPSVIAHHNQIAFSLLC